MKRLVKMAVGGAFCLMFALITFSIAYGGATANLPRAAGYVAQIGLLAATLVLGVAGLVLLVKTVVSAIDR